MLDDNEIQAEVLASAEGSFLTSIRAPTDQTFAVWAACAHEQYSSQWAAITLLLKWQEYTVRQDNDVDTEFRDLVRSWKAGRSALSSTTALAMHPDYQRIISFGWRAVPLILDELAQETDHWFWALKVITREDPVPPESRGRMQQMADAWLAWGRQKGYVR